MDKIFKVHFEIIHGSQALIFKSVAAFIDLYNREWEIEKLDYRSQLQARADRYNLELFYSRNQTQVTAPVKYTFITYSKFIH